MISRGTPMPKHHAFARFVDLDRTCTKGFTEDEHDEETYSRRVRALLERECGDKSRQLWLKPSRPALSGSRLQRRRGVQRVERCRDYFIADDRCSHHIGSA